MESGRDDDLGLLDVLAGSPYFATTEPIADLGSEDGYLALARTIEREVIPRLILNTRRRIATPPVAARLWNGCDIPAFCQVILTSELAQAEAYVNGEIAKGTSQPRLLLELFAPTARRLGELWETDECSFVDVTIALGKLQQLLRLFSETYRRSPEPEVLGFRALLATLPDSQHIFGLLVVEELFRRSGWTVLGLPSPSRSELLDAAAQEWFAVVGLSISCDDSATSVAALITEIRAASLNKSLLVLVGGRYVTDNPSKAMMLGADLVGADAQNAIESSQDFLRSIGR